jgi:disulfide bond formation protein DsbB
MAQRWRWPLPAWLSAAALAGLAMIVSAGIGVFHVGVEQKWWAGPTGCSASNLSGLSPAEAAKRLMETPVVRCDEIAWSLLGISMAGWNAIISAVAGVAVAALAFARVRT